MSGFDAMIDNKIAEHGGDIRRLAGELMRLENFTARYGQYRGDCVRTPMPVPIRCREQTAAEAEWLAAYQIPGVVFGLDGQVIDVRGSFVDHCTRGLIVTGLPPVMRDLVAEQQRQVAKGYDAAHDDLHADGELVSAASAAVYGATHGSSWAHGAHHWFAHTPQEHTPREWLVIAARLLVAEIERIDRAEARGDL